MRAILGVLAMLAAAAVAAEEPPLPEADGADFEPTLDLYEMAGPEFDLPPEPPPDVEAAEREAKRLEARAARWARLVKIGAMAPAEADRAAELACDARLKLARAVAAAAKAREGATEEEKAAADAALRKAELAHAKEKLRFAEVWAGRAGKLAKAGVGSKRLAAKATGKLAEARERLKALEAGKN